jgi:hypothetical protein
MNKSEINDFIEQFIKTWNKWLEERNLPILIKKHNKWLTIRKLSRLIKKYILMNTTHKPILNPNEFLTKKPRK